MASAPNLSSVGSRELLRMPAVRGLWIAQIISVMGDFLAIFAVFSLVSFKLHGSPAEVSLITISYLLPAGLVSPVAGVFVDRWHPRRVMIVSDLTRAVLILILIRAHSPVEIYLVFICLSAVSSFFAPAQTVMLRSLVPTEGLMAANALMMQAFQVVQIVSPAVAGILCKLLGERVCFILDSISFLASAWIVMRIPYVWHSSPQKRDLRSAIADLQEGMKFIFSRGTLAFTILAMGAGLFAVRCFSALISVYVRDILKAGTGIFGMISAMIGIGMILGSQLIRMVAKRFEPGYLILSGLVGVACTILVLALTANLILALIATIGIGVCVALIIVSSQSVSQGQTPIAMLGRVSSSTMAVMAFAQVGGMALSGSIAQAIGIRKSYLISSLILFGVALIGLRYMQKLPKTTPAPETQTQGAATG
jgi:DHA3 family macrolide efflux protein-like MFS transporter